MKLEIFLPLGKFFRFVAAWEQESFKLNKKAFFDDKGGMNITTSRSVLETLLVRGFCLLGRNSVMLNPSAVYPKSK